MHMQRGCSMEVSPRVPACVPGAAGVCTHLLGWGRGCICMRDILFLLTKVSAAAPTPGPPSPRVPMHGGGCEVAGKWWGDGGVMAGRWWGDGGKMAGR